MRIFAFIFLLPFIAYGQHDENCPMQSPVNIVSKTGKGNSHQVIVHYKTSKEHVANLGHTVEVDYDSGSYVSFDGLNYDFKQFHFHTPSEHTLDNNRYPLEMHIVHVNQTEEEKAPLYLVIGVFFELGKESHFLNTFLSAIPDEEGKITDSESVHIDATEMVPPSLHNFYNYRGSLTTPPYTESVNWIVLKEIKSASRKQVKIFQDIEGNNARKVQALYNRTIESVD